MKQNLFPEPHPQWVEALFDALGLLGVLYVVLCIANIYTHGTDVPKWNYWYWLFLIKMYL